MLCRLILNLGLSSLLLHGALGQRVSLAAASQISKTGVVNLVYIGDSITEGGDLLNPAGQAPPAVCTSLLRKQLPGAVMFMSNQGRSGHTTVDALPSSNSDFPEIEAAAKQLQAEHPGLLVFSIMLGTNDSAESGPNGAPVSPESYGSNLREIASHLLRDFPGSIIVLQRPTWYSPNTHNSSVYEAGGLARLQSYFPVIESVARSFSDAGEHVYQGDTSGFGHFAAHYKRELIPERGASGTFYLHPNVAGAKELGGLWASAILGPLKQALKTPTPSPKSSTM